MPFSFIDMLFTFESVILVVLSRTDVTKLSFESGRHEPLSSSPHRSKKGRSVFFRSPSFRGSSPVLETIAPYAKGFLNGAPRSDNYENNEVNV